MSGDTPRVTVFTPSHRTTYLDECFETLVSQTYRDWEWVVLLNDGARWRPPNDDGRVRVVVADDLGGIGAVKRHACLIARGEFLVELDHDDLLSHTAIAQVVDAFDSRAGVGMVYSHCAQITAAGTRDDGRFDAAHGWTYLETDVDGRRVLQANAMQPTPHNVSYIWYAPNHIRAYRRSAYDAAGGYDPERVILDDQDLMCRLYQQSDFHLIDECLYLQRMHPRNTQRDEATNATIQRETVELYDRYIQPCVMAWSTRQGLAAIDLGPAQGRPSGYTGVAGTATSCEDPVVAMTNGLDLPDSSVGVIRAADALTRTPDKIAMFNEMYRLLAPGGMILSLTPSTDGRGAFQDPAQIAYFNENSFWYYSDPAYAGFVPGVTCRFQISRLVTSFPSDWHEQHQISYVNANLIAVKDGPRQGGLYLW